LIFEDGEGEFAYTLLGTCFLATYGHKAFVVTARHCLRQRPLNSMRIRLHPGMLAFVRLIPLVFPRTEGNDSSDLSVFAIHPGSISAADFNSSSFLNLDPDRSKPFELSESSILALAGYPAEINSITYQEYLISTQGIVVDGHYCGPGEESGCSKIRFNSLGNLEDMNGLSGSPVVQFKPLRGKFYRQSFAGMLIRGTKQAGEGRFVNAPIIYQALDEARPQ